LHDGGVHDAVTAALPGAAPVTLPTLPNSVLAVAFAVTDCWLVEVQVSGIPVSVIPMVSCTVASTDRAVPELRRNDVVEVGFPGTLSEMVCTGQVVNVSGCDVAPPTLAKIDVVPGMPAVAICWLSGAVAPAEERETDEAD
jgi:hypothetical protein